MEVPSFLKENTELKLKKLNKVDEYGAYFSIAFLTDVHNAETTTYKWLNSIRVIEEVNKRKNINYILTGGDYINNHEDKDVVINRLKNFKDRFEDKRNVFITLGNHDDNSNYKDFSKVITHEEIKKLMFSDMQDVTFGNGLYYYKDFHEQKIRLIVLNSEDIPEYDSSMKYKGQWDYVFSNEQLNWVAHTALNTDYKVIFCSHTPMVENVEGFDLAIRNSEAMLGIMKAYTLGESYSSSNSTGDFKYNVSVNYDKKGTIVCCLFGHVHADNIVYRDNIAHISTTCSNCSYRYGSSYIENATGTENEIALDYLTIRNNMCFLTRFGAGKDRSFKYVNNTCETHKEKSYPGIKLRGQNKELIALLQNVKDLNIESVLESGDKTLSFSYSKKDKFYDYIIEENYIETKEDQFVIKAKDTSGDYTAFTCVLNLEELEGKTIDRFESVEQTVTSALNLAIVGTGWTIQENILKKKRTVRCTSKNALEIVKEIKKTYRVDIVFNTLEKKIEIYEKLGEDKGTYFIDSLNLKDLQVQSDSYKFATRIIAEGKDGLTFEDINNGKNYVENYQYSNKVKTIYWKDERYTVKESLLEDAKAKLEEISKPFTSYNASILNLAELNPKYKNILDYQLGDTITFLSKSNKVRDKQRIVKTIEWPQDHTRDTVELANAILKFEDIQQENQEAVDTVSNITTDNGTVDGSTIDSITTKQIEDFKANVIEVVNLKAINASIDNLHAIKADIQDLNAVTARIGTLEATKANITQLNATNAEISKLNAIKANVTDLNAANGKISILESRTASIDNLVSQKANINDLKALNATISEALIKKATIAQLEALETKTNNLIADKASIKDLDVTNANINKIQAETASIKTLLNGNLSSENIQAGGITSDKLTIANGFITNLMISSVSASKITTGTIDAAKINVVNLNADNLTVGKINGQLLKDGSISGLAIENGAIDNNKVSPNANIEASKINISSVVTAINKGSTLLTANKVSIDSEKGTLDVAFNKLNTSLEANKKATESNSTAINVVQGKLSAYIENSKILEGKQKTLEDNYNRTVVTVDSLKNTVGQQKTLIDSATGKITSVEVKANTLEKNLSGLTQIVTDTKKVIENNKTVLESKNAELKANIDKVSSSLSSVSSTVDKNNKTLVAKTNTLEQNLNGLTQTVANNKTDIDGKITSVEGETHELKAGLGGLTSKLDTLKSTTDGINKTVSNQGSVINQLKDSIKLKVDSSTFTQLTTVINNNINKAKEDAINTSKNNTSNAINSLDIGTYNLALESGNFTTSTGTMIANGGTLELDSINTFRGFNTLKIKGQPGVCYKDYIELQGNTIYCYSCWIKSDRIITLNSSTPLHIWLKENREDGNCHREIILKVSKEVNLNWQQVFVIFKTPSTKEKYIMKPFIYGIGEATVWLANFQVKKGSILNDWSMNPSDLKKYSDDVAKAKADLAQANAIANSDGKITEEERKRIQQAQENLNTAIARADKVKADAKAYSDTLGQQLKADAEKYANNVAIAKASEAETKAKTYVDAKKQEAINAAENLALEKSNLAKKYAEDVATAKANLAKTEAIANADGKIDIEEKARIKQAQDNLNTAIAKADKVKQDAINEANRVAELKKQQAINSASTDATNKANSALNNAKAYTNTEITTVNSHLNKATAEINVLKEKIESKVSQSDIDKSIQEIKISGINLLRNSDYSKYSKYENIGWDESLNGSLRPYLWSDYNSGVSNPSEGYHAHLNITKFSYPVMEFNCVSTSRWLGSSQYFSPGIIKPNCEYTFSIYLYGDSDIAECQVGLYYFKNGSDRQNFYSGLNKFNIKKGEWNRYECTFKTSEDLDVSKSSIFYIYGYYKIGKFYCTKSKLEEGNFSTGYSKAPEDMDQLIIDNIKTVTDKISTVESKLTQENNSIKASVRDLNSTTQTITTNVSNINRDLTSKINSNLDVAKRFATDIAIAKANLAKEQAIANADGKITEEERKRIAEAKKNLDTAIARADKAKQDAINTASTDATNKANSAKQQAIIGARSIPDTRSNNENPRWYIEHYPKQTITEFKYAGVIGVPNGGSWFGTLETKVPWNNSSGGYPTQVFRSNSLPVYQRRGINDTIWSAWEQIEDTQGAQDKANGALNNAKAYTNAQITTVNSKVHNVESGINILKDQIKSKVGQSDIEKAIQKIEFGGRNLLLNTGLFDDFSHWSFSPGISRGINKDDSLGNNCHYIYYDLSGNTTDKWQSASPYAVPCTPGEKVSAQAMVYVPSHDNRLDTGANVCCLEIQYFNSNNERIGLDFGETINSNFKKDKWVKVLCENKTVPNGAVKYNARIWARRNARIWIGKLKLEKGTKCSDWTPAPEDTNQLIADSIKVVDTKISDVSSSVTQLRDSVTTQINSINSKTHSIETTLGGKANKQEVTEVNNKVSTIKASLDSITQRVSSTESKTRTLESNLNGKASKQEVNNVSSKVVSLEANLSGITNRVSSTESRINTLNGQVANAVTRQQFTEFQQSNDKFKFTVEQRSSVSNILPNGSFFGGDRGWLHNGVEFWAGAYSGYGFKGRITGAIKNRAAYNNPERYLQTHKAYKVKKNTTYTINFHYICEKNVQSMDAFVVLSNTEYGDYAQPLCILTAQGGSQSNAAEEKPFTYKFNTGNHEWVWLRFDHNGMKLGTNWDQYCWLYVSEIGIYEGDVGAVKWAPKGGEVYSANYQMDGLGFKGTFEDGTYASLGKDGLEWYNAGTGHAYHALTYVTSFDIPVGNPGKAYIRLPAEFTKRRSSLKWTVALRGYYYNTTGNFFPFHVHCTGARDYIENGLVVCEVQGLCKIQNGSNSGDVQFRPLTAMLIAIA